MSQETQMAFIMLTSTVDNDILETTTNTTIKIIAFLSYNAMFRFELQFTLCGISLA